MKITDKQREILEDNFNIYNDEDNLMELESWTDGGVDMIIYIDTNNDLIEELKDYVNNFNIDEEIDLYRESKDYRDNFTISESLKDFEDYIEFVKGIIKQLEESDKNKSVKCPLCNEELEHIEFGKTHIYRCEPCPFIGFEYIEPTNIDDLVNYLKKEK
jgi:hypothetical protein